MPFFLGNHSKMSINLDDKGAVHLNITLTESWRLAASDYNFSSLDHLASNSLKKNGFIFETIKQHLPHYFSRMKHGFEHILSLRQGPQEEEFDGIWHDDGSRLLAFSLSLNIEHSNIKGGHLSLRKKGTIVGSQSILPRPFGVLTIFATGQERWEHKTNNVQEGSRIVLAGWLT